MPISNAFLPPRPSRVRFPSWLIAALILATMPLVACQSSQTAPPVQVKTPAQVAARARPPAPPVAQAAVAETAVAPATPKPPLLAAERRPEMAPAPNVPPPQIVPYVAPRAAPRVALLLPLSGPNGVLGKAMLNAAQLALFDFADRTFELLVHDTMGTPEGAREAADLALDDGAALILGPLLAASVDAVAPRARAAGVNVLAFSSDRMVAGDGVFILGFLPSAEVDRVVAYAAGRGVRRFAALVPDNAYGVTVLERLDDAAAARGGEVVQAQLYDPRAEDFTEPVLEIAAYGTRRGRLEQQIADLEARPDEVARRALARLEGLRTVGGLPYQALLIADGGKRLQALAALLPFFDVDPSRVRMLGTGQWDEPGVGAEPALVGGWFAAPAPETRDAYERRYAETYGNKPPRLSTLAYDATALAAVLAKGGPDFSADALTAPQGFAGRDGIFRLRPDGLNERGLAVLRIAPRGAKVIDAAPEIFAAPDG